MNILEEQKGQKAFKIHQEIAENEQMRRELLIKNILNLKQMFDENLYESIQGEGVEHSWQGYLGEITIFYSRARVARWIYILNQLELLQVPLIEVITLPETRLEELVRVSKNKEQALELIEQAKVLSSLHWRDTLNEIKGKPVSDLCSHLESNRYEECKVCGFRHRI